MADVQCTPAVEYRPVPNFPAYRVGSDGSVWSLWEFYHEKGILGGCHRIGTSWKKLKPRFSSHGYLFVTLCHEGKHRTVDVSTIVLEAFVGPRPEGMEACHTNDRTPTNCRADNLRWDTHHANILDKKRHGTHNDGEKNPAAKLTAQIVIEIRTRVAAGEKQRHVAASLGLDYRHINDIVRRRSWKHLP